MKPGLRQSMASLHTWTGLVPGWLLFVIFLFGTAAFLNEEISRWMRPELTVAPVSDRALDAAGRLLKEKASGADSWSVSMPAPRDGEGFGISWTPAGGSFKDRQKRTLDAITGAETAVRDTKGGYFLYRMHFDLHYLPVSWARILVCLAALAMLVAILSGIVTHKKIFADFFLLRFGKGQRSWLDAHNVTAVLALPFHLMITYTGLVTLLFTIMPWAISANFPDRDAYSAQAFPSAPDVEPSGQAAPMLPFSDLLRRAEQAKPGLYPSFISIRNPGDSEAVVEMYLRSEMLGGAREPLQLRATTGEIIGMRAPRGPATATQQVMIDLHAGRYSSIMLRWLYFLSGVGGTIMVASGLVLWTVKRRAKLPDPARPHFGFRLVERLNIGFIAGAPVGIAAYFLANRFLPIGMADRAAWEVNSLFIVWGGLFVWAIARPVKRAWCETLAVGASLFALVPVANMLTTARGLPVSLMAGDILFVTFDLTMLALAAAFAFTARRVATHQPKAAPRRKQRALEEATA
jgi:uncharacterized iron-regulated membrane protein